MSKLSVKDFLEQNHVRYSVISHTPAYTAPEIAANCHIPGKFMAKVVIVKADGKFAMAVVPANQKVNLKELKGLIGVSKIELATEYEFKDKFPDCELGAMPPFGNLYDMDVYVAEALTKDKQIAFNAGNHSELIRITYQDFAKLVHPSVFHH
jgi:Ala-tRNA(Pro) deacylase